MDRLKVCILFDCYVSQCASTVTAGDVTHDASLVLILTVDKLQHKSTLTCQGYILTLCCSQQTSRALLAFLIKVVACNHCCLWIDKGCTLLTSYQHRDLDALASIPRIRRGRQRYDGRFVTSIDRGKEISELFTCLTIFDYVVCDVTLLTPLSRPVNYIYLSSATKLLYQELCCPLASCIVVIANINAFFTLEQLKPLDPEVICSSSHGTCRDAQLLSNQAIPFTFTPYNSLTTIVCKMLNAIHTVLTVCIAELIFVVDHFRAIFVGVPLVSTQINKLIVFIIDWDCDTFTIPTNHKLVKCFISEATLVTKHITNNTSRLHQCLVVLRRQCWVYHWPTVNISRSFQTQCIA